MSSRTPLHHWHSAHGARFTELHGWQVVAEYGGVQDELAAARAGVGLADISAWAKLALLGSGVGDAVRLIAPDGAAEHPRGVASLADSQPTLACRLAAEHLLLLSSTPDPASLAARVPAGLASVVRNAVTCTYAGLCLAGPRVEDVLRRLTSFDVSVASLPIGSCAETGLAGVHAILVRAHELTVSSVRVYVAWDLAEYVWETLLHGGQQFGISALGLETLRALAISAAPTPSN